MYMVEYFLSKTDVCVKWMTLPGRRRMAEFWDNEGMYFLELR